MLIKDFFSGKILILQVLFMHIGIVSAQTQPLKILTRLNYYMNEQNSELLFIRNQMDMADTMYVSGYIGTYNFKDTLVFEENNVLRRPFVLRNLSPGKHDLVFRINGRLKFETVLEVLPFKNNSVQIDRYTGGLIVAGLPFFPFGFYCYSPVQPRLAEEEVVKGFNMMSPYQDIERKTRPERRAYMDRCAELGMKVHYNVLKIAGGGGIGALKVSDKTKSEKRDLLIDEVNAFKDHPALLGWYIADEPVGQYVEPQGLIEIYNLIKKLDPYHPVTIVFMTPSQAHRYDKAMDIVMADPYPLPHGTVTEVSAVTASLLGEYQYNKPVWIVPQAFGGGEHWAREPTRAELRVMTYLSLIEGAAGIQYFIRSGLNAFPKSTTTWNECGAISLETAEMTPLLLDYESRPPVEVDAERVQVSAWQRGSEILVLAANTANKPETVKYKLRLSNSDTLATVLFENRTVHIDSGFFTDIIDALDTRAYIINLQNETKVDIYSENKGIEFENSVSPGIPVGCYARIGKDRGATYFTDSRFALNGRHSLRLVTPVAGGGISLGFFGVRLRAGQGYKLSVKTCGYDHAAGVRLPQDRGFIKRLFSKNKKVAGPPRLQLGLSGLGTEIFSIKKDWMENELWIQAVPGADNVVAKPSLQLLTRGMVWCDDLKLTPDPIIKTEITGTTRALQVSLSTTQANSEIHYTLNGTRPDRLSQLYRKPFIVRSTPVIKAVVFSQGKALGSSRKRVLMHKAFGEKVQYLTTFSEVYPGTGKLNLVDGEVAGSDFKDERWQAFLRHDLNIVIDLGSRKMIKGVEIRFLQDIRSWIFLPQEVRYSYSVDGEVYSDSNMIVNSVSEKETGPLIKRFADNSTIKTRFIRIQAVNRKLCPAWHPGAGGNAWLFADEVIVR